MNPIIEEIYQNGYCIAEDGTRFDLWSAISQQEGQFIASIVRDLKPTVSVEIGMALGLSTLFITDALANQTQKNHIVIDPNQYEEYQWLGLQNVQKAGFDNFVTHHNMYSYEMLPQLLASGVRADFAFIDGNHLFDHAFLDFFYLDMMLNVGGVIVFDDSNWPAVRQVCRHIIRNRNYSLYGYLSVKRVPKQKARRPLRLVQRINPLLLGLLRRRFGNRYPGAIRRLAMMGLIAGADCIAFRKEADDTRSFTHHHDF